MGGDFPPRLARAASAAFLLAAPLLAAPADPDASLLRPSAEIDLLDAALAISYDAETLPIPPGDRERWIRYVQGLRGQLLAKVLAGELSPQRVAREAARILFDQEGFTIDARWSSAQAWEGDFFLLPRVLSRRQGVPLSISILLVALVRDTSIPASIAIFPGETFAVFGAGPDRAVVDPAGRGVHPWAWLHERCPLPAGAPPVYGRPLSTREILAILLHAVARHQIADRRPEAARAALVRAGRLWPHYPPIYLALGTLHLRRGDLERADLCFRRAAEIDPSDAQSHRWLGEVARLEGELDRAEVEFRSALEQDARLVEAHIGLGRTLLEARRPDEAEASFRRAAAIDPLDARAAVGLGLVCLVRGEADAAEAALAQAIDLDPTCAEAYRLRGELNETLWGDHEAALADLTEAIRLDPEDPSARRLRALLYDRALGRPQEALADYRAFIDLSPRDPWAASAARRIREIAEASGSAPRPPGS